MSGEIIDIIRKIDRTIYGPENVRKAHVQFLKQGDNARIDINVLEYAFQEIVHKFDTMEDMIHDLERKIEQLESK